MPSNPAMILLLLPLLLLIISSISVSSTSGDLQKQSAYQVLQQYDFPIGLLPKGVIDYELNRETGDFKAYFNGTCNFSIESYELKYKSTIKGVISKGKVTKLSGVSVKVVFLWLNIVEIVRDGDDLEFSVGIASADFPVESFVESPQCGCGFDCEKSEGLSYSSS